MNTNTIGSTGASRRRLSRFLSGRGLVAGLTVLLITLTACAEVRYEFGRSFDTEALEASLTVGQSGEADVREALGEPDGVGRYLAPVSLEPRAMWTYYYETGTAAKKADRTMLFVLFREEKYDGYLWFADTLTATPTN